MRNLFILSFLFSFSQLASGNSMRIWLNKSDGAYPGAGFFIRGLEFGQSPFKITEKKATLDTNWLWVEDERTLKKAQAIANQANVSLSRNFFFFNAKVNADIKEKSDEKSECHTHRFVGLFKMNSFAATMGVEDLQLSNDAKYIIENKGLVGFQQAYGQAYTISVDRTGFFLAVFEYKSYSHEKNTEFEHKIQKEIASYKFSSVFNKKTSSNLEHKSLTIKFDAYGLRADEVGFSVAPTNEDELRETIKNAGEHLTQSGAGHPVMARLQLWQNHPSVVAALINYKKRFADALDDAEFQELQEWLNLAKKPEDRNQSEENTKAIRNRFLQEDKVQRKILRRAGVIADISRLRDIMEFQLAAAIMAKNAMISYKERGVEYLEIKKDLFSQVEMVETSEIISKLTKRIDEKNKEYDQLDTAYKEIIDQDDVDLISVDKRIQNLINNSDLVMPFELRFALKAMKQYESY